MKFVIPAIFWGLALFSAIAGLSGSLHFIAYAIVSGGVGALLAHHAYVQRPIPSILRALAWVTLLTAVVFFWVMFQVLGNIH